MIETNTENEFINRIIRYSILLVIWSAFTAVLLGYLNHAIVLISLGLYLLIVIFSLINISQLVTWMILLLGGGVVIYLNHKLWGLGQVFYLYFGLIILTFLVGSHYSREIFDAKQALNQKLASNQQMMERFMVFDPETSLMRKQFAEKALTVEVARSQRLSTPLSLMTIRVPNERAFPDGNVFDPNRLFSELFRGNLRENIDIAFIDEDYGAILPEMDCKTAQLTAWQMVQDMKDVLGIEIKIGIASMTEDNSTAEALIASAKSALETAIEIDQPIVPHLFIKNISMKVLKFSDLLEGVSEKTLLRYFHNPSIGDHEWIVWLEGIQDMAQIVLAKAKFHSSSSVEILGIWDQFLVVKLTTGEKDAAEFASAFGGWQIYDADIDKRFAWVVSEQS